MMNAECGIRTGEIGPCLPFGIRHSAFRIRPAFTLVELVFSLVIISVLMLAVGSVLRLALLTSGGVATTGADGSNGNAGSAGAAAAASRLVAADVADQMAADMNVALTFTEKTNAAVTFTVPNRTGGATPDTLRYAWYGSNGNPSATPAVPAYTLTRELNGGGWTALAADVRSCNFSTLYRQMTVTPAAAEQLLGSWDPSSGTVTQQWVSTTSWVAAIFKPAAPAGATAVTITRVRLLVLCDGFYDGVMKVQVRGSNGSQKPVSGALATVRVPELAGSNVGTWVDVYFNASGVDPTQYYAIVVGGESGTVYGGGVPSVSGAPSTLRGYTSTTGGGPSAWSNMSSSACPRFYVFGTAP